VSLAALCPSALAFLPAFRTLTYAVIYLSVLSDRIPILPPFRLVHEESPESVPVSDIFDLHFLAATLDDLPIVELHELKKSYGTPPRIDYVVYDGEVPQVGSNGLPLVAGDVIRAQEPERDVLGCWSAFMSRGEVPGMSADGIMDTGEIEALVA